MKNNDLHQIILMKKVLHNNILLKIRIMKKVTYTLLFILLSFTCNAQRFVEVAQWQVVLANNYKVFGIAPDLATAEANILKFKRAHKSKKFAITTSDIRYATIALGKQGQDPYHRFRLMAKNVSRKLFVPSTQCFKYFHVRVFWSQINTVKIRGHGSRSGMEDRLLLVTAIAIAIDIAAAG